jgi:23S rRNA (adenine2503-C2)-methyltransferase
MKSYQILSYTSNQFSSALFQELGKGLQQAKDLYKAFLRHGTFYPVPSSFANAPILFKDMESLTDTALDPFVLKTRDEASGVEKFLVTTQDGYEIESVVLPMKHKKTLCLSSQIGCRMGCSFCETGKRGLIRNLTAKEMIEQFFHARFSLFHSIDNVVFMGMGEPLDNLQEVMKAYEILSDPDGVGLGRKNITISTSGHVDSIEKLVFSYGPVPNLAVSLNAPDDLIRSKLMPINHTWNMARLKQALLLFAEKKKKEILIAYVLIEGVNDSIEQARQLISYLDGLPVKINCIPYNAQSGFSPYRSPSLEVQDQFLQQLRQAGKRALLRRTKGDHIMAGCGQLGGKKKAV